MQRNDPSSHSLSFKEMQKVTFISKHIFNLKSELHCILCEIHAWMDYSHPSDKHIPCCACPRYFCLSTSTFLAVSKCQSFFYLANRNVHLMFTSISGSDELGVNSQRKNSPADVNLSRYQE